MTEYLLELYLSRTQQHVAEESGESARAAAEELSRHGTSISYRRSFFVPAEETLFVLFEAESADAVRDAARLASLSSDRISIAISQS
jgi:Protein of unknown function (DUF4242)